MKKSFLNFYRASLIMCTLLLGFYFTKGQTPKSGPLGICYVEVNNNNILNAGAYTLKNGGQQLFDVAIIFAANINYDVAKGRAVLYSNNNVTKVLSNAATYIQPLQAKGIKVLLDVLGNHQGAGICNFKSRAAAKDFAQQIAHTVNTYGLDGIDFDDEYSDYGTNGTGQPNDSSLVMLVQEVRNLLPTKIISFYYYGPASARQSWNGYRVGDYVNYSWNANYSSFSVPNVPPLTASMKSPAAVWVGNTPAATVTNLANQTKAGNYGLFLWYDLHGTNEANYLSSGSVVLYNDSAKLTGTLQSWSAGTNCDAPIGHTTSNLTTTSATLSWTAVGANTYTVDYKPASSSTWINAATATSNTSVSVTGLTANTAYDWRVKTNCTTTGSTYSFAPQFTTPTTGGSTGPRSLTFNGSNQYINAGNVNISGTALSMEAWIKPAAFKTASPFISTVMGIESGSNAALIRFGDIGNASNKLQFVLSNGTSQIKMASVTPFVAGNWYHVAATYDGATMKLYVNGVLDASLAQAFTVTANGAFNIGYSWDLTRCFNGSMDEARVWKKALTAAEIQANMCSVNPASTSLEGYWKMDEGIGTTSTADATTNGHTGTMMNMTATNWNTNIPVCAVTANNYALSFNGTNQSLNAGTVNLSGTALSMEGWVKANAFKSTSPFISTVMGIESGTNTALLRFGDVGIAANKMQFVLGIGAAQVKVTSATAFNTGTWYHVAATYDGATVKLYVNGILDASATAAGSVTANATFNIGKSYTDNVRYWNGNMDELRVWKKALTQAEIQANMCTVPSTSTSLEGYWKMNEGTGTTTADVTGHAHTGTFVGMTAANFITDVPSSCGTAASLAPNRINAETSIQHVAEKREITLAPNPLHRGEMLTITVPGLKDLKNSLSVFSVTGQQVLTLNLSSVSTKISTSALAPGVYMYSIKNAGGNLLSKGKFIVQ